MHAGNQKSGKINKEGTQGSDSSRNVSLYIFNIVSLKPKPELKEAPKGQPRLNLGDLNSVKSDDFHSLESSDSDGVYETPEDQELNAIK